MRRVAIVAMVLVATGCSLDVGSSPDASCTPAPDLFVSDVWPRYLAVNHCADRGCHDFADGHGTLRLRPPESPPPAAGLPLAAWPLGWRENYLSTIQLVRCDRPLESRLLTVPEGQSNLHPPGPVVRNRVEAQAAIAAWVGR